MTNSQSDALKQAPNNQDDDEKLDVGALIATVLNGKYLIIFFALTFLALGVFKSFLIIPSYQADAMLQIEEKSNPLDALAPVSSHKPGQCE